MTTDRQLFYNLLTRDALLIHNGVAHSLEGPYDSRDEAERAADELIGLLDERDPPAENGTGFDASGRVALAMKSGGWLPRRFESYPSPR